MGVVCLFTILVTFLVMISPPGHRDRQSGAILELLDTLNHPLFLPLSTSTFLAFSSCPKDLGGGLNHKLFANVKIVFQPLKFYPRRSVLQLARVSDVRERGIGQTLAPHPGENLWLYRMLCSPDFYVFYEHQL